MNKREKQHIDKVKKDSLKLKKQKLLTEYGQAQLDLIEQLEKIK